MRLMLSRQFDSARVIPTPPTAKGREVNRNTMPRYWNMVVLKVILMGSAHSTITTNQITGGSSRAVALICS